MTKRKIILIAIISTILLSVMVTGIVLSYTQKLTAPAPKVMEVTSEPDYNIKISWKPIFGAKQYVFEYKYKTVYPNQKFTEIISDNSVIIKRVRGELEFRVQALSRREKQASVFSEWKTYNVEGLKLDRMKAFGFSSVSTDELMLDSSFEPVKYIYKGIAKEVEFYEYSDNHNPDGLILSFEELKDYKFNFPAGTTTTCKFRPVTNAEFMGSSIEGPIELKELYDMPTDYITIRYNKPE